MEYQPELTESQSSALHPVTLVKSLREMAADDTMVLVDAGNHRAFTGHYWKTYHPKDYYQSAGMAPMGWSIPASIGAKLARPNTPCLVMVGDGCMLMHGQEIQTAARHGLDITYIVFNNSCYGATYFNNKDNLPRLSQLPNHNWALFAESLGVKGIRVTNLSELQQAFKVAENSKGPVLLDVLLPHDIKPPTAIYRETIKQKENTL